MICKLAAFCDSEKWMQVDCRLASCLATAALYSVSLAVTVEKVKF